MKQFKVDFPLDSDITSLFIESMDDTHRRYSVERSENDPHPLLIEYNDKSNTWEASPGDTWSLNEKQIHDLGCKILNECDQSDPVISGINAK